jgi:hypothetical protein
MRLIYRFRFAGLKNSKPRKRVPALDNGPVGSGGHPYMRLMDGLNLGQGFDARAKRIVVCIGGGVEEYVMDMHVSVDFCGRGTRMTRNGFPKPQTYIILENVPNIVQP